MPALLVLDDDPVRSSGFGSVLPQLGADCTLKTWSDPAAMLAELDGSLGRARLITLEATHAEPIVEHLASRNPTCPVLLYFHRNRHRNPIWEYFRQLRARGWDAGLISGLGDGPYRHMWYSQYWLDEAHLLLRWRTDTRANRAHAANCAQLSGFEGREAIYVEKYVRRIRVSHLRAHVDGRYVQAWAEEILTPGLGAPGEAGRQRWRFGGGYQSCFSKDTWSNPSQHVAWHLYFAPAVIDAVVRFADKLPPEEVYRSTELLKLIWQLTGNSVREEKQIFPD